MLLSASRRTDIPAFYTAWLLARLRAGEVLVRNPYAPHQVYRLALSPETVDGMVLWTKDARPLLPHLQALAPYPYYVQYTLTAYGKDVEPGLPDKAACVQTLRALSRAAGAARVWWRYDPIFLTAAYTEDWHAQCFAALCQALRGYTQRCTVSFLDTYRHTSPRMAGLGLLPLEPSVQNRLLCRLAPIAKAAGMALYTCAETLERPVPGVLPGACVDAECLGRIAGYRLAVPKDKNQRGACGCAQSVDIGIYSSCPHGCLYCYANRSAKALWQQRALYDPASPLLCSRLGPLDSVRDRHMPSYWQAQHTLF